MSSKKNFSGKNRNFDEKDTFRKNYWNAKRKKFRENNWLVNERVLVGRY